MIITSPGQISDFIFHDFAADVVDHGDCLSVRTRDNPDYFFGNLLSFPTAPGPGDLDVWLQWFETVFGGVPGVRHQCFQWSPTSGIGATARAEFTTGGFSVDRVSVLTARAVHMDMPATPGITMRPIRSDADWRAALEAQVLEGLPQIPSDEYRRYKEATFFIYREMSEAGFGDWWGAFKGGELVADLGLYFGRGIGRFQSVETRESYRRQGICRSLVHHVSQCALTAHPDITLMIHADAGDAPERIYKSVGYETTEIIESAYRPPDATPA